MPDLANPGAHERIEGLEHLDKLIAIDQSPIGRTPRSNPATYIKLADDIRDLFTELPESKARGYKPGRFSFNVASGRCEACEGNGSNRLEMDFLADVWVTCPVCNGHRFNRETLQVRFKGKSIADVLEMDVQEALTHFENIPDVRRKLQTLHDVGLDYVKLGQPSPTLSGGEAQRIKLARELVKRSTCRTLYLLDEPTTGLHFADIQMLLKVLHDLVDAGNTVLVVEHNLDVIKTADWIIDLGPEGGAGGGEIVAVGTPEQVVGLSKAEGGRRKADDKNSEIGSLALAPRPARFPHRHRTGASAQRTSQRRIPPTVAGEIAAKIGSPNLRRPNHPRARCRQHNLKGVDVDIPRDQMTVCCGLSGSGKSSLAMDTIYAEGQRRYVESLSSYARQFVGQMQKPKLDHIEGLSPAIAIEQKNLGHYAALHGRHRHGNLRLSADSDGAARQAALPIVQRANRHAIGRRNHRKADGRARGGRSCFCWPRLKFASAKNTKRCGTKCGPADTSACGSTAWYTRSRSRRRSIAAESM